MNTLSKCIEELKKDQPDIRYIIGMLETYVELSSTRPATTYTVTGSGIMTKPIIVPELVDEEQLPHGYANGPIGKIT